jgi:FAD/FMN-containing dehydrogenase
MRRITARHGAAILPRGAGTSMCGQSVNAAVVIDCSKHLNQVVSINSQSRLAIVQPGAVCDALREAAGAHGLTFAPDPATRSRCTAARRGTSPKS